METFRHQKSPGSERFLGLFSHPETPSATNGTGGVELDEDDVFWNGNDFSESNQSPKASPTMANPNPNPNTVLSPSSRGSFRRLPDRNFGILAALPEDDKKRNPRSDAPFLQRRPSISTSSSASTSPSSSARMIPAIPKPKMEYSMSVSSVKIHQQSAPVNVPVAPRKARKGLGEYEIEGGGGEEDGDEDEMLPPHEIVARGSRKESPMTTFSVLEGAGRTLKGRDLRRVRNAVWRTTGFID